MNEKKVYDTLAMAIPGTMHVGGLVLMNKNDTKWHLCKKDASSVRHACGNGAPTDPNRTSGYSDGFHERQFNKSAEVATPEGGLELGRMCSSCERIMQDEFNIERLTIAVSTDEQIENTLRRVREKIENMEDN